MSKTIGLITIEHPQGIIVLKNARWHENCTITGIVVSGGHTERSDGHRSFKALEVDSEYTHESCDFKGIACLHTGHSYIRCIPE